MKNPAILDSAEYAKDTFPTSFEQQPESEVFRLMTGADFQCFVDTLLNDGDVVFRASFAPGSPYLLGRTRDGPRCKVLAAGARCLVFDDHPEDWVPLTPSKVILAKTPMNVAAGHPTDVVDE